MPRRLAEYDPLLKIVWRRGAYWIVRMTRPPQDLFPCLDEQGNPRPPDARDLERIRASDSWRRRDILASIDEHNDRIIRSRRREQEHIQEELQRDARRFLGA